MPALQKDAPAYITIRRPSNFHAHFRDNVLMQAVTKPLIRLSRYVLAMPNTGPITTIEEMVVYHRALRRLADANTDHQVDFVMTLYLTEKVRPSVIEQLAKLPIPCGVKYYPPQKGATTGSGLGVPLNRCEETLTAMAECGIPLLGHFELVEDKNGHEIPHKDREGRMVDEILWSFRDEHPKLKISFEHASTRKAVEWVKADTTGNSFMTATPQHSLFSIEDRDVFGVDFDCMPIEKTPEDRDAVAAFITSGDARVGAGGDEAPHPHKKKLEGAKGCWTPQAPEMYADVFDQYNALDGRFEKFMSLNAPLWWGLPLPSIEDTVTFVREKTPPPEPLSIPGMNDVIIPLGWSESGALYKTNFRAE